MMVQPLGAFEGNDEHTKFLFHMDGDLGRNQHQVLLNGTPTLDVEKTKWNGSIALDGTSDYISLPDHMDWDFYDESFTIDMWVLFRDLAGAQEIIGQREDGDKQWRIRKDDGDSFSFYWMYDGLRLIELKSQSVTLEQNVWYHLALVRNEEQFTFYVNGKSLAQEQYEGELMKPSDRLKIGAFGTGVSATSFFNGNIDELRISKGVARWTDEFSEALPAAPCVSDEDTVLLLSFDGDCAQGATTAHNLKIKKSTYLTKDGRWNGSYYFDGKGNYVASPDSDDWSFGTDDFTVDFWVRVDKLLDGQTALVSQWHYSDKTRRAWVVYVNTNRTLACCSVDKSNVYYGNFSTDIELKEKQWHHIAFVRDGKYHKLFVDGKFGGMIEVTGKTMKNARQSLEIGRKMNLAYNFSGAIDEVRITKGLARWTDDFSAQNRKSPYGEVFAADEE